ncbi:MAG: S8 family serine peptidase [Planctomycetota bacterium]|nr:S8 family serine peptidase [Planctomycetota bacterium]
MRPVDRSRALQRRSRYETFEERLALTAQPIGELSLVPEQQLQHHYSELAPAEVVNPLGDFQLETIAEERVAHHAGAVSGAAGNVHDLTGVNYVFNNYGFSGQGQTVAVIDSGIAWDHVALGGGLGSGYRVVGGYDFAEGDADPYDDGPSGFHGTHVAGIVGSSDATHRGVASGVDLVGLRVFDDDGAGYFSMVEEALQWVHDHRNDFESPITTVNLSLGTTWNADSVPTWSTLEDEFARLEADGIFIAVSAGNSFSNSNAAGLSYPAASPYVVPVASVDNDGSISDFSQRSARVLAAPGRNITSTVPDHVFGADGNPNDFGTSSGTSMASPYVAGASVLVRQAMEFAGIQNITQDTIYDHLRSTASIVYDAATTASYHLINLEAAIKALMPSDDFGSTSNTAYSLGTLASTSSFAGVIGSVTDADYFTFTAGQTGRATFSFDTTHQLTLDAKVIGGSGSLTGNTLTLDVIAGRAYTFALSTTDGVGHYAASVSLASASGGGSAGEGEAKVDPLAKAAYDLDQAKALKFVGKDYLNWGGTNEKWLQGSDGWYFIRPSGEVYKWVGSGKATGTLVAKLDASYYADLSKLYDAKAPATSGGGATNGGSESAKDTKGGANDAKSGAESTLAARARELDSQYGFTTDGKYYENWAGHGEKWFRSDKLGWVFITPDGSLYDWNGNQATAIASPKVAQLDASFHKDPTLLTDPPADTGSNTGNQGGSNGSSGSKSADAGQGKNETGGGTSAGNALAKRAYELDQQLGLRSTGDYYQNWAKLGEKWMTSTNGQWYFMTGNGSLYRWNGSQTNAASSTLIAKLDASFHADPSKLHDAPSMSSSDAVTIASSATFEVEDAITVVDTRNSIAIYSHYNSASQRALARDHVLASTQRSHESVKDETLVTSRVHFFADYDASDAARHYRRLGVAGRLSTSEDDTAVDCVYDAFENGEVAVEDSLAEL